MNKTVVFGGAGFVGSHVADALLGKKFDVVVFDKEQSIYLQKGQTMVVGDILDRKKVRDTIRGARYVYHFAGIADIHEAKDKPVETVTNNVLGTLNILDACREFGVERIVYASTIYVYGEQGSFYRSSKQSCELFIENFRQAYRLNFTVLRYGSLYGTRANAFNFIHNIVRQALIEKRIQRKGDGNEIREYINVVDAARSSVDILTEEFINSYVIITGMQTMKVRDLLAMIKEILGNEITIEYLNEPLEDHYEITPYAFRPRVAKKYIPPYYHDLGEGILECIHDVYHELLTGRKIMPYEIVIPRSREPKR